MIGLAILVVVTLIALPVYGWKTGDWDLVAVKRAAAKFAVSLLPPDSQGELTFSNTVKPKSEKSATGPGFVVNLNREPRPTKPVIESGLTAFYDYWQVEQVFGSDGDTEIVLKGRFYTGQQDQKGFSAIRSYETTSAGCQKEIRQYLQKSAGTKFVVRELQSELGGAFLIEIGSLDKDIHPNADPLLCDVFDN